MLKKRLSQQHCFKGGGIKGAPGLIEKLPILFLFAGAGAILTISITPEPVLFGDHDNFAPFRRNFKTLFTFEKEPVCRQRAEI